MVSRESQLTIVLFQEKNWKNHHRIMSVNHQIYKCLCIHLAKYILPHLDKYHLKKSQDMIVDLNQSIQFHN